jgi:MFS family permease
MPKIGEERIAFRGVASCAAAFAFLALVPRYVADHRDVAVLLLYLAAFFMAATSASVVPSLTAYTSLQCDQDMDENVPRSSDLAVGKVMGDFRSSGQAGRAIGPLIGVCFSTMSSFFFFLKCTSVCQLLDVWTIKHLCRRCGGYVAGLGSSQEIASSYECFPKTGIRRLWVLQLQMLDLTMSKS